MRAAVFHGDGILRIEDWPEPRLEAPDEVLIEVEACGICGTDLQITNRPPGHPSAPPVVLGHEFVGRVKALGPTAPRAGLVVGQRVVVDPDPKCGLCAHCRAGRPANCENIVALGIHRDGGLAPYVVAPAGAVYPVSDAIPATTAALIEPLACVVNGANRANARPGESAVVFGAGAIGCLFVAMLKAAGAAPVIAVEPAGDRRAVAIAVGADAAFTPEEFVARAREVVPGGAEILVDAVGTQLPTAVENAALGGRIIVFGQNANARPPVHQYTITERSLTIMGTYITNYTFPAAIRLVEQAALPLAPIVTHVLPLDRLAEGMELLRSGRATKVVITPSSGAADHPQGWRPAPS